MVFEDFIEELIGFEALGLGEVVLGVGGADDEVRFCIVKFVDLSDLFFGLAYTVDIEVGIVEGGVGVEMSWGECGDDFVEIERDLVGIEVVGVAESGHVAVAGPTFDVAVVVVVEGCPAAGTDDDFKACVECGDEDGVVPAE